MIVKGETSVILRDFSNSVRAVLLSLTLGGILKQILQEITTKKIGHTKQ